MIRAPPRTAMSGVPSVESPSTTRTSATSPHGTSASTRSIDAASLNVGMMTETRTRASPERDGRKAPREDSIQTEAASGPAQRHAGGHDHGNEELPDPRGSPLRDPEAREEAEGSECDETRREAHHEHNAESELGHRLGGARDGCVVRHESHDGLPRRRRVSLLDVVVNEARIAAWRVQVLAQILEEHPDEHRPEREPQDGEEEKRLCAAHVSRRP